MSKKLFIILFLLFIILVIISYFIYENSKIYIPVEDTSQPNISYLFNDIVPDGFSKVELPDASWELDEYGRPIGWNNGLVVEDANGNQFVWVPCSINSSDLITYGRYFFSNNDLCLSFDEQLYTSDNLFVDNDSVNDKIKNSVEKYGGFYIGRYETGIENGNLLYKKTRDDAELNWTGWRNGNIAIKQNLQVWNHITLDKSIELSNSFINTENVGSSLLTSYCYDTTLKWISSKNSSFLTNMYDYGNFSDELANTGTCSNAKLNNIHDLIGNVWEWCTEKSVRYGDLDPNRTAVFRGCYWGNEPSMLYDRVTIFPYYGNISIGFRIVLYLK